LLQNLSNLVLDSLVDSACTASLGRLFHMLTMLLVEKEFTQIVSCTSFFVILNHCLLVVSVVDVVRFGTGTMSYLPDSIL